MTTNDPSLLARLKEAQEALGQAEDTCAAGGGDAIACSLVGGARELLRGARLVLEGGVASAAGSAPVAGGADDPEPAGEGDRDATADPRVDP